MAFITDFFDYWPMLLGAAAAAIPLILHLLYRKRAPKVPFSTVRFLILSVRRTAHRRRIQELLLLLLRAAALFLLAFGLAGFRLRGGGGGSGTVAIVLDNSYSMGTLVEGVPRYATAKQLAQEIVRSLGSGSSVALFFTHGRPPSAREGSIAGTLTTNREQVLAEIVSSEVSPADGSVTGTLLQAETLLREAGSANRAIYVITDLQQNSWGDISRSNSEQTGVSIPVVLVDCGSSGYRNLAITKVEVRGKGLATGVPLTIDATVLNCSSQPQRDVQVLLRIGAEQREVRTVDIAAGATAAVSFTTTFSQAGAHTGAVMLNVQDSLPLDNLRYFAVNLSEQIDVLLVKSKTAPVRALDPTFYVVCALDPSQAGVADVRSVIKPRELLTEELPGVDLRRYAVLFLLDPASTSTENLAALRDYVSGGGHLVLFPGDAIDTAAWNNLTMSDGSPLLPAEIAESPEAAPEREEAVSLTDLDFTHPILAGFRTLPRAAFEEVRARRWRVLKPRPAASAVVLMRLRTGAPLLVEGKAGAGKVLLFAVPPTAEWTNLPVRRLFLPLLHEMVYHLAGATDQVLSYLPGAPVNLRLEPGIREVELRYGAERVRIAPDQLHRYTFAPGVYEWQVPGGTSQSGAFAVNPVPQESDLTRLDPAKAVAMLSPRRVLRADNIEEVRRVQSSLGREKQLSNAILILVILVAAAECFLANYRRKSSPEPQPRPFGGAGELHTQTSGN